MRIPPADVFSIVIVERGETPGEGVEGVVGRSGKARDSLSRRSGCRTWGEASGQGLDYAPC